MRYAIFSATAVVIAFGVANYVVKANSTGFTAALTAITDSINNTSTANASALAGLQASIDTLNVTIQQSTVATSALEQQMLKLTVASAKQEVEIKFMREDLTKLQDAVQGAGITVPALYNLPMLSPTSWGELKANLGVVPDQPIYLDAEI